MPSLKEYEERFFAGIFSTQITTIKKLSKFLNLQTISNPVYRSAIKEIFEFARQFDSSISPEQLVNILSKNNVIKFQNIPQSIERFKELLEKGKDVHESELFHYANIKSKELYKENLLLQISEDIIDGINNNDLANLEKNIKKKISLLNIDSDKIRKTTLRDLFDKQREVLESSRHNPSSLFGIPTGIKKFDDLSGGLRKQETILVVAPTGVGKSLFLMSYGLHASLLGFSVVYCTIEMPSEQIALRTYSNISNIDYQKFRKKANWLCGESLIKTPKDIQIYYPECDAFIVGQNLVEFCKELEHERS